MRINSLIKNNNKDIDMHKTTLLFCAAIALLLTSCWGTRYVSADADLENVYMGKSYYDIVAEYGLPDATFHDRRNGTFITYNSATLTGEAQALYSRYEMRNSSTKEKGAPAGTLRFAFSEDMKCYGVESNLQRKRESEGNDNVAQKIDKNMLDLKPRIPRTLDFPFVERRSPAAEVIRIERIEITKTETNVFFGYMPRTPKHRPTNDKGICIHPDVFIRDCSDGKRMAMKAVEGITLYPEYTDFAHNWGGYDVRIYTITFEPLPENVQKIDIVEPGAEGFNFYGIDVRTPLSPRDQVLMK